MADFELLMEYTFQISLHSFDPRQTRLLDDNMCFQCNCMLSDFPNMHVVNALDVVYLFHDIDYISDGNAFWRALH